MDMKWILAILCGIVGGRMLAGRKGSKAETTAREISYASGERRLEVRRASQVMNSLGKYRVTVNGRFCGTLGSGESLHTNVEETAAVSILCGSERKPTGITLKLQCGANPCLEFETAYGGSVKVKARDAVILSQNAVY